jgi:hypothetical protein
LEGVASGTNSAFREVGGVLGIAVLGAVFSSSGSYSSTQDYVNGLRPAILVGAVAVLLGTFTALFVPALRRARTGETSQAAQRTGASALQDEGSTRQDLITSPLVSAA